MMDTLEMLTEDFAREFEQKLEEEFHSLKKPNVLIAGRTGTGKSTLINAVFGNSVARVGSGRPVTDSYTAYEDEDALVNLYDSSGWEGGAEKEKSFLANTAAFLGDHATGDSSRRIHVIWYTLDAPGARFTDFDIKLASEIFRGISVLFVLTKCDIASDDQIKSLRDTINESNIRNKIDVIEISADPITIKGYKICEKFGLSELVKRTVELLPELHRKSFIGAQRISLDLKAKAAQKAIIAHSVSAFGAGFIPIPFASPFAFATIQAGLVAQLAIIYGFKRRGPLVALVAAAVSGILTSAVWPSLTNLLKLLPGMQPLVGVIDGAAGALMTGALGLAYTALLEKIFILVLDGQEASITRQWATDYLLDKFEIYKNKIGNLGLEDS